LSPVEDWRICDEQQTAKKTQDIAKSFSFAGPGFQKRMEQVGKSCENLQEHCGFYQKSSEPRKKQAPPNIFPEMGKTTDKT